MKTKKTIVLTIDEKVLEDTKKILKTLGMKPSGYTEVLYRALVESQTTPAAKLYSDVATRLSKTMKASKSVKVKKQ